VTYPTITVEAAFTVGGSFGTALVLDSATKGILDTNTLSAEVWTDITAYARAFSVRRGASRAEGPVLRFEAGTAQVTLDNSDRRFDPTNLSGPYVSAGVTQVTPMRAVRITATWDGTVYPVFRGYADAWDISYDEPAVSTCVLSATDATKVLSNYDRVALGSGVGAGENSGARVNRVLDSVSWPVGDEYRSVAVGDSMLQATTLDRSAWEELLKVQDSEIGHVFVDAAGRVVFRNRHALMEDPRSANVQGVFGDDAGEMPFVDADLSYDDTTLNNVVRIANVGGTQQTAEDVASQQQYLVHTYDRTDLILQSDEEASDYASFILYQTKDPELRFTDLSVTPHDDPGALFPQVLGRDFGDRISLTRDPPGGGSVTREAFVVGVSHEVGGPNEWRTTWALMSATKWSFMTFDNSTLGVLDANALAY